MRFRISAPHPSNHLIYVELSVNPITASNEILFQLPSWRPGRYELGNFAKNIHSWKALNEKNELLAVRKISKDCWKVLINDSLNPDSSGRAKEVHIHYTYYASEPTAGGCWLDEDMLYINPIHCCLYVPELIQEECLIEMEIPESYLVATSLNINKAYHPDNKRSNTAVTTKLLHATNYHELVDSPILASPTLQHQSYEIERNTFHIWIQGECQPDWARLINDFRRFTVEQVQTMGDIPIENFQFLVLALPYKFYHGVEHLNSTMLAFGPGCDLMKEESYIDFIGLASHELFHVWNIKTIRPLEMMPYDYTKENYSRLGFVYEGVTTYYGDLFLVRSGVYTEEQFLKEISHRMQKHFDNYGRFNMSVADSSFDTWLDGYTPGIPWRKTSIYDEGCLIALMCDLMIRAKTNSRQSLDDVMRSLYYDFGKKNIGYTERDYISLIENMTNESAADFFIDYVYGTEDYEPLLTDLLHHAGCHLLKKDSPLSHEHHFGFKINSDNEFVKVTQVAPDSPAFKGGLSKDDEIVAVDEQRVEKNLNELLNYYIGLDSHSKIHLKVSTPMKKLKTIALEISNSKFFPRYTISKIENPNTQQQKFFSEWLKTHVKQPTKMYGMN